MLNIMVSVSQWEREAIRERTRDAMRHKKAKNEWNGNAPYGYRLCEGPKHVEPEEPEQKVLRRIKKMRECGSSLRQIAAKLNREGIRTRSGGTWRHEYIARVLNAA